MVEVENNTKTSKRIVKSDFFIDSKSKVENVKISASEILTTEKHGGINRE